MQENGDDSARPPGREDEARKRKLLGALEVFASISPPELAPVVAASGWLKVPAGEVLFGAGGGAGALYVVERGEVLVSRIVEEGREVTLATFLAGDSLGEMSLFDSEPGGTTARCEEDTTLLVFPAPAGRPSGVSAAEGFFAVHPRIEARVLHNLLGMVAGRIRSANRLVAEKTPWARELRRQVMLDKLTGLYNSGYLEEDLVALVDAGPQALCVLMMKPDNFKAFNDSYGHDAGDRILQRLAVELRSGLGEGEVAIRYRGDVFAAVLPGVELPEARRKAERLRAAVRSVEVGPALGLAEPDSAPRLTVSIGIAAYPGGGRSAPALVERAYTNLFTARGRGGDRLCAERNRSGGAGAPARAARPGGKPEGVDGFARS